MSKTTENRPAAAPAEQSAHFSGEQAGSSRAGKCSLQCGSRHSRGGGAGLSGGGVNTGCVGRVAVCASMCLIPEQSKIEPTCLELVS